ncbi:MAG: OsmC family protein [Bacillota bacterium]|nr:OsmC family protein [Bacillota bacterium]
MEATVRFVDGLTFLGRGESNHWIAMDGSPAAGGTQAAPTPMELVLMALGGCSGMDVVSILRKKRVTVDAFEIRLKAQRAQEHPKVFTEVEMEYVFTGRDLRLKDLEDAVRLSQEKYCSVAGVLRGTAALTYRVTVRQPAEEEPTRG